MEEDIIDQATEVEVEGNENQEPEELESNGQTEDSTEDQAASDADESEEIEFDGEKYKVPKELKDAFLRQADYTKKTQEVAEQRREFEAQQQAFQQRVTIQQQHLQDFAELQTIDAQMERFQKIDWQALIDQDPVEAMKLDRQYRTLAETRLNTAHRIQEVQQREAFESQQNTAKAIERGREVLEREIPNWSGEKAKSLKEFAVKELRIDRNAIESLVDPQAVIALYYAQIGYQSLKKAAAPQPKQEAKPIQKVSSKRDTSRVDPDKLSADDWVKWREKQLRSKP